MKAVEPKGDPKAKEVDPKKVTELRERAWHIMARNQQEIADSSELTPDTLGRMNVAWDKWRREASGLGLSQAELQRIKDEARQMLATQQLPPPKPGEAEA